MVSMSLESFAAQVNLLISWLFLFGLIAFSIVLHNHHLWRAEICHIHHPRDKYKDRCQIQACKKSV